MKIAINARHLHSPNLRGWNRYTSNLLAELSALGTQLFLYSNQALHESHLQRLDPHRTHIRIAPPMHYLLWEQHWLSSQLNKDQPDIFHCPVHFGVPWFVKTPVVLTLHDAIDSIHHDPGLPLRTKLSRAHAKSNLLQWVARNRADHIITVSNHSKKDLVRHFGISQNRITPIHEAAEELFHPTSDKTRVTRFREMHLLNRPYFFYAGGWEKRKNLPFLLKAFAEAKLPDMELVLSGGSGQELQKGELLRMAENLGIKNQLQMIPWIEDKDLPTAYAEATAFIYPSEYEGFGLQLCEAMRSGTAVLAARKTCLPEILGSGGETFSLDSTHELTCLMKRVATDVSFRNDLTARALVRARDFSWKKTAQATLHVYQSLL